MSYCYHCRHYTGFVLVSAITKSSFTLCSLNLEVQYLVLVGFGFFVVNSFILISATTRWCSEPASALHFTLLSWVHFYTSYWWPHDLSGFQSLNRGSPRGLVGPSVLEKSSANYKSICHAEITKQLSILIDGTFTVCSNNQFPIPIVWAHFGIQITHNQYEVSPLL